MNQREVYCSLATCYIREFRNTKSDYYEREGKAFVIAREFYPKNGRENEETRRSNGINQIEGYRPIEGKPRIYGVTSQTERGEKQGEVKYALSDMPFFSDEDGETKVCSRILRIIEGYIT
jgi:hypothetical protein